MRSHLGTYKDVYRPLISNSSASLQEIVQASEEQTSVQEAKQQGIAANCPEKSSEFRSAAQISYLCSSVNNCKTKAKMPMIFLG